MKKISVYIAFAAALLLSSGCEGFFDREPIEDFAAESFFASELDLQLYCNGLLDVALPEASDIAMGEDLFTDFCATQQSKTLYEKGRYNAGIAGGWSASSWAFLRRVAYMLDNMSNAKGAVSEKVYNHYEGVARFWRAYATFSKVRSFGDCYFIDHVISADDELLYAPRQDREYVMHRVVEDLDFACRNCLATGADVFTDSRVHVNKWVALAMASRICLYEGTYRKYHLVNPSTGLPWSGDYESSAELLRKAADYSKEVMDSKVFSLHDNFRELFVSDKIQKDEVIWGRSYSESLAKPHSVTYHFCSTTSSQLYSPTKDYIMMFLGTDGNPVAGTVSVTEEFNNRDKRLAATVVAPGQTMKNSKGENVPYRLNFTWTRTGYSWLKWIVAENRAMTTSTGACYNCIPVLRYAEVLLNRAEAAAELGEMDATLWENTVGALRKRAGVTSIYPESGAYTEDLFLKSYYSYGLMHKATLSNTLLEIRRERATELMLEGDTRFNDLMRWRMGDLITRRYDNAGWRGIYLTPQEASNGFTFNGRKYTVSTTKGSDENNYLITSAVDQGFTLSEGTYGYLIYHYTLTWEDKLYTRPIPTTALNVNPNLGQNEGWQWQ